MQIGTIGNSGYEHANRVYKGGCCPVLQSRDFKDPIKVIKKMSKYNTNPSNIYILGEMDNSDGTFESANRIYDVKASAPTIPTSCGGGHTSKVVKLIGGVGEENEFGSQFRQQNRVYDNKELSVSMTSAGINGLYPRKVETMDRNYKQVIIEDNKQESYVRKEDGIVYVKDLFETEEKPDKEKTVEDYLITAKDGEQYGIFKLSVRECMRLQNVRDSDIDKIMAVNSNTQCYKQAGNSICCSVLVALFSQLNIKGVKQWNNMTDDERYSIIKPGG